MYPGELASVLLPAYLPPAAASRASFGHCYHLPADDHFLLQHSSSNLPVLPYPGAHHYLQHADDEPLFHDLVGGACRPPCWSSNNETAHADRLRAHQERRKRRLLSNRESARRSRTRKHNQLSQLQEQVVRLQDTNRGLLERLNRAIRDCDGVVRENYRLREERADLQRRLEELPVVSDGSPESVDVNVAGDDDDVQSRMAATT